MTVSSDQMLLASVAAGDRAAFGELYDRYAPRVLGLLMRMLSTHDDAEDILQEVYIQVWRTAAHYDAGRASPAAWIFMIARSRACDALRRSRLFKKVPVDVEPIAAEISESFDQVEHRELIARSLARLPAAQRSAIELAFFDGLTHAEIAVTQGVPLGTAKTRIRLGMLRLRDLLAAYEALLT